MRALGFDPVELDADKPTWSGREAEKLNKAVDRGRAGETPASVGPGGRTLSALILAYKQDPEYLDKKSQTRRSYAEFLRIIDRKFGADNVVTFTKPAMRKWYLTNRDARGEHMARALARMMSILFSFSELNGWRAEDSNPCRNLKMRVPRPRSRVATWVEMDAILDAAIECGLPSMRTGALLSALQGQRQTDVIYVTAGDFKWVTRRDERAQDTVLAWRVDRSKRGTLGLMQLHPIVLECVEPLLNGKEPSDRLLIEERTSRPYNEDAFKRRWAEVRRKASETAPSLTGDTPLQFRDLRRTFAVWSKAGGSSDDDVGDVLGNSAANDPALQETYMPSSFETASRAVLAIQRPKEKDERKKA